LESSDEVADVFLIASRALVGVAARSLADVEEVTLPQFRALVVLASRGSLTVSELAHRLDIHPSTATRLCDRLVRKRLIRRVEGRPDRRETDIVLASAGRRLVDRVTSRRRRDLAAIAKRMSAEERQYALAGLRAFAEAAGENPDATLFGWPELEPADSEPAGE
jgi:DNA-binding MarR family transcriptional regulator